MYRGIIIISKASCDIIIRGGRNVGEGGEAA